MDRFDLAHELAGSGLNRVAIERGPCATRHGFPARTQDEFRFTSATTCSRPAQLTMTVRNSVNEMAPPAQLGILAPPNGGAARRTLERGDLAVSPSDQMKTHLTGATAKIPASGYDDQDWASPTTNSSPTTTN
jgi:hypothetical protein